MNYIAIILLLSILGLLAITYRKARNVHLVTYELIERVRNIDAESKSLYGQIQAYIDLKEMLGMTQPLPRLRGWAASPDFLIEVAKHAIKEKPRCIVECSSGASTIVLARCAQLSNTGHVFSLEHDAKFAEITRNHLEDSGLSNWATVIVAPLESTETDIHTDWYSSSGYKDLEAIELLVVDGPPAIHNKHARYPALPILIERFADNAAIYLDDTNRAGEREIISKWLKTQGLKLHRNIELEKGGAELRFSKKDYLPQTSHRPTQHI